MRKLLGFVGITMLAIVGGLFFAKIYVPDWAQTKVILNEPTLCKLEKGESLATFSKHLEEKGLISSSLMFRVWIRDKGAYKHFQAGQYRFEQTVSPEDIRTALESGKTYQPIALQFVIPEGFTIKQVIDRLEARNLATRKELEDLAQDKTFLQQYRISGPNLEGFLFPATYTFYTMPAAREVFQQMLQKFADSLPKDIEEKLRSHQIDLYQAVTMASMIERETQVDTERSYISEVIWNRLRAGEPLGIDAALIYGIKDYAGDIKWEHLKDPKNPYNNRLYKGLPPTPIGAISMASLEAVFTPSHEGFRYYVLANDGSKNHRFSKTLEEHNFYVKQLLQSFR